MKNTGVVFPVMAPTMLRASPAFALSISLSWGNLDHSSSRNYTLVNRHRGWDARLSVEFHACGLPRTT